jgi:hypothetical protein
MKNNIFILLALLFLLSACKTSTEPETNVDLPTKDTLVFKFDSLATFPYSQSLMLSGYLDKIFIYGSHGKYSVYYTENKTIVIFSTVNDTITWRWDGAFATVNKLMFIFAIAIDSRSDYQKVLTFNPVTYEIKASSVINPFNLHMYPASTVIDNKILILYPTSDSLYVFNTLTMTEQFVSKNLLKIQFNGKVYSSGVYGDGFYVYGNTVKQLFRINTTTYTWEEIIIPDSIKTKIDQYALGGIIGNKLCLFNQRNNSKMIIAYNVETQKWLIGPQNNLVDLGEPYFYSTKTGLYVAEVFSKKLWKISLIN